MRSLPLPRVAAAGILLASVAILLAAFAFQHWGNLAPCVLCIWQRYPYGAAIALAVLAALLPPGRATTGLLALCGVVFMVGAGVAVFHVGVEHRWWEGTAACGSTLPPAATIEELRARLLAQPVVRCDEVPWSLFGLSMAGYNVLLSLGLAAFSFAAARLSATKPGADPAREPDAYAS